jgi:hypothetical protein
MMSSNEKFEWDSSSGWSIAKQRSAYYAKIKREKARAEERENMTYHPDEYKPNEAAICRLITWLDILYDDVESSMGKRPLKINYYTATSEQLGAFDVPVHGTKQAQKAFLNLVSKIGTDLIDKAQAKGIEFSGDMAWDANGKGAKQ